MSIDLVRKCALGAVVAAVVLLPAAGRATGRDGDERGSLLGSIASWVTSPAMGLRRASLSAGVGDFAFSIQVEMASGRGVWDARDPADRPPMGMAAFADACARLGVGRSCDAAFLLEVELGTRCASLARGVFGAFDMPFPESVRSVLGAAAKRHGDGALAAIRAALQ